MRSRLAVVCSLAIIGMIGVSSAAGAQIRCRACDSPSWDRFDRVDRHRERAVEHAQRGRERAAERAAYGVRRASSSDIHERVDRALEHADRARERAVERATERAIDRADRVPMIHGRAHRIRGPR